jgi:hypothetical protein
VEPELETEVSSLLVAATDFFVAALPDLLILITLIN